jgi:hypothetical protein
MKPPHEWTAADVNALVGTGEDVRTEFKSGRVFEQEGRIADELSK